MSTNSMEYTYIRNEPTFAATEFVVARVINFVIGIVEVLLAVRLVLHFLGAGGGNSFMVWLDGVTGQLVAPFSGIFPDINLGGFPIELSTIFAMIVYSVIGWILVRLVYFLFGLMRTTTI